MHWTSTKWTSPDSQRYTMDTAFGLVVTTQNSNMEWTSLVPIPESNRSSVAPQFPTELFQFASQRSQKSSRSWRFMQPTSTYDDGLVEAFYEVLVSTIKDIPRKALPIT